MVITIFENGKGKLVVNASLVVTMEKFDDPLHHFYYLRINGSEVNGYSTDEERNDAFDKICTAMAF